MNNKSSETSSTNRFALILLEPGEIYFEDYLVYYYESESPFLKPKELNNGKFYQQNLNKQKKQQSNFTGPILEDKNSLKPLKGNLKICSKSVIFDPINLSFPLLKFQYKSIELIEQYIDTDNDVESDQESDFNDIHSLRSKKSDYKDSQEYKLLKKKCFCISSKQVTKCKFNNRISPYIVQKRQKKEDKHFFQFIFTDTHDTLDLMKQLKRASTLDYEHEDLMLQMIVKSRLSRQIKFDLNQLDDMYKEQIQLESEVCKIGPLVANPGKIILSNMCIYYKPFNNLENERQILKIKLKDVKYVIKRRYHLKKIGCEIIFDENISNLSLNMRKLPYLYLTFDDEKSRDEFYTRLVIDQKDKLTNLNVFSQENMLQKWRYGTISNFDYLMHLNNTADRSYNDLTQYPVFPWVLSDYVSEKLDLNDHQNYRDLSKPIGALNENRLKRLRQRCKEMQETTTGFNNQSSEKIDEPLVFLYGTHYSTPAFVSFFLVRQMPEWQLCLQNGRFDDPNRLFHNIADTWRNCLNSDSDVKELIPEFYDINSSNENLGIFLQNKLELDLGIRQDKTRVNNVILPKWANNSPVKFIKLMREALESTYVSENLHKWIDLIFGYKQRGKEALKSDNLFYYLCYEGAVDLENIKNYSERKSLEIQIQEFGQIPTQLFDQPHLPKVKVDIVNLSIRDEHNEVDVLDTTTPTNYLTNNSNTSSANKIEETHLKHDEYAINPTNFKNLSIKLTVKLHKEQINDCLFIETNRKRKKSSSSSDLLPSNKDNFNQDKAKENEQTQFELPLVCSVSNDNWIKIYSLEEKSIFRSYNVSEFSLSSVDCLQISEKINNEIEPETHNYIEPNMEPFCRTLLFLSCWDNAMYIYDMNYNRCIFNLPNAHDDAISRSRILNIEKNSIKNDKENSNIIDNYKIIFTSSWDSLIKVWILPLKQKQSTCYDQSIENDSMLFNDSIKTKFLCELALESSIIDFQLSESLLATVCEDGNLYMWSFNAHKLIINYDKSQINTSEYHDESMYEDLIENDSCFNFINTIQNSDEFGKINDCKIIESPSFSDSQINAFSSKNSNNNLNNLSTIAVCTSLGYIKIYNIESNCEIFSIRLSVPNLNNVFSKLNKLFYYSDYILTIGSNGYIYFVDLQQADKSILSDKNVLEPIIRQSVNSSFLSHTIKLSENQLLSLSIFKNSIISVGDSAGNLYFLSLVDF